MRSLILGGDSSYQRMPISSFSVNPTDSLGRVKTIPTGNRHVSDSAYLTKMIDFLKLQRKTRGLSCAELNQKARLSKGLIERAESKKLVPTTREFKGWSAALGFKWEDVWTLALLSKVELSR